ncbi:hypothetical protein [Subtercola vilae]|nr:hypothetical protein [Subtercola vilae]
MSDKKDETPDTSTDTQQNHNAETDEDTASGGAAADTDPKDL